MNQTEEELRKRYDDMLADLDGWYDGRNTVDVFKCRWCFAIELIGYRDVGVSSLAIKCTKCGHLHEHVVTLDRACIVDGAVARVWMRPTFEQLCNLDADTMDNVLHGGLILCPSDSVQEDVLTYTQG